MTKNEYLEMPWSIEDTIENLKTIKEHFIATVLKTNLDGKGKQDAKEVEFDFNRAIQALEEIQQYRAIGTVEELQTLKEHIGAQVLRQYEAIGTVEGYKRAIEISKENFRLSMEYKAKVQQYEAIGTIEEFKALKEKNTKKRFNIFESHGMRQFVCGCCDRPILTTDNYCGFCGQKLDWK